MIIRNGSPFSVAVTFKDQTYSEQCQSAATSELYIALDVMVEDKNNEEELSKAVEPLAVTETISVSILLFLFRFTVVVSITIEQKISKTEFAEIAALLLVCEWLKNSCF